MNYPEDFIDKIICGDCLEVMKGIPNKSIDLVLTDPPYSLRWKDPIDLHGRKAFYHHKEEVGSGWDSVELKELYKKIFTEFDRIIKDNGSLIIFTSQEGVGYVKDIGLENNFDMKASIIWKKTNPVPQVRKKNYLSSYESIVWLARWDDKKCNFTFNFKTQKEMYNFIEMPICSGSERTEHPTQKPLDLIERFIEIHSNPNDIVLDPFLGSGTTAVACKKLNRHFIGIEINPKYCKIAEERLKKIPERLDNILGK